MAGFETTDVAAKGVNPLKTVESLATLQNTINQNKMFQAKALAGQYLSQSLGPDGQPDPANFSAYLNADKRTAPYAPEILESMQTIRRGGTAAVQATTDLASAQVNNLRNDAAVAGTASPTGDPTENSNNVLKAWKLGVQSGRYTPDQVAEAAGNLGSFVRSGVISGAGGTGAQTALTGTPTQINTGGQIKTVAVNPYTSSVEQMDGGSASIPTEQSPEFRAGRVPTVEPGTNKPISVPQASVSTPTGEPIAGGAGGLAGSHGELAAGLSPGVAEAQSKVAVNAADQMNELHTQYGGSASREGLVKELLATQGEFRSGPGATKWSGFVTEANRILGTNFSPKSTPSQQVFTKITEQLAAAQRSAMGLAPTDEQIQMSRLMNPNNEYSPEANKQVGALLLGNEKRLQFMNAEAEKWKAKGGSPDQYQTFVNGFNPVADPRIFQEPYMTAEQKHTMISKMSVPERKRYEAAKTYINSRMKQDGIQP